mgnify:CR=1 FL=1
MNNYTYEDIDSDIYSFYRESVSNSGGDVKLAIAEASVFFMEDETFIEDVIDKIENGIEEDENA